VEPAPPPRGLVHDLKDEDLAGRRRPGRVPRTLAERRHRALKLPPARLLRRYTLTEDLASPSVLVTLVMLPNDRAFALMVPTGKLP